MARPKKQKITVSDDVKARLLDVANELSNRGAKEFDISALLDRLVKSKDSQTVIDEFVDENTPDTFKVSQLMNNPLEREKIQKLLEGRKFGLRSME